MRRYYRYFYTNPKTGGEALIPSFSGGILSKITCPQHHAFLHRETEKQLRNFENNYFKPPKELFYPHPIKVFPIVPLKDHVATTIPPIASDTLSSSSPATSLVQPTVHEIIPETSIIESKDTKPEVVYNISGICQIHKFAVIEKTNKINKDEYTYDPEALKFAPQLIAKAMVSLFSGPPIKNSHDLCMRFALFLNKDNNFDSIYYYPMAQHIIVSLCARLDVPMSVFMELSNNMVNFSEFIRPNESLTALGIIEQYFFKVTFDNFMRENTGKVVFYAQNEGFLELNKEIEPFKTYRSESYRQTGQPNADGRFEISKTIGGPAERRVYIDYKAVKDPTSKLSLSRGHVSLATNKNDAYLIKRAKGDYPGSLENKDNAVKKNTETNVEIKKYNITEDEKLAVNKYCKSLDNLLKSKYSLEEKVKEFTKIQKKMLLDEKLIHVIPSFISVPPQNDPAFSYLLENSPEVAFIINEILLELSNQDVIEKLFPIEQKAYVDYWLKFISKILHKMPPSDLKEVMIQNYKRTIELL